MRASCFALLVAVVVLLARAQHCAAHLEPFHLCYDKPFNLSVYHSDQICDDIDLVGSSSIKNFQHCRVVSGYVAIRHLNLKPSLSFANLEVITDFLMLYHVYSKNGTQSLNTLFPKLRFINGRRLFLNSSLFISHFYADNKIEMNALTNVCGPVWISNSHSVCFRHSAFYWQIQPKVNFAEPFERFSNLTLENFDLYSLHADHFHARIKIWYNISNFLRNIWMNFRYVRLSIYQVDRDQYSYMLDRLPIRPNCTDSAPLSEVFNLNDLTDSDHVNVYIRDQVIESLNSDRSLASFAYFSAAVTLSSSKLQPRPQFNFLRANYDILSLMHTPIHVDTLGDSRIVQSKEDFLFQFDHIYLVKVYICFGVFIENCTISNFYKFMPTKNIFGSQFSGPSEETKTEIFELFAIPNVIVVALISAVIFIMVIILITFTRFKSILKRIYPSRLPYRITNPDDYGDFAEICFTSSQKRNDKRTAQ